MARGPETFWLRLRRGVTAPRRQHLFAALPALAVVCLLAAPTVFLGRTLFPRAETTFSPASLTARDALLSHLPLPDLARRRMAAGDLPLWNPHIALGMPLAANNYSLVFAPLNHALRGVHPTSRALSWRLVLLAFLGAWALYGFLRLHGAGLAAAALGGALYPAMVLRYLPVRLPLAHYAGTSWAVIGLFLLALALRRRALWGPAAAVALGILGLTGHPHVVYWGLLVCGLYVGGATIAASRAGGRRAAGRALLVGGGALAAAVLVGAAQLLPTVSIAAGGTHAFEPDSFRALMQIDPAPLWDTLSFAWLLVPFAALQRRWVPLVGSLLLALWFGIVLGTVVVDVLYAVLPFFRYLKVQTKYYAMPFALLAPALVAFGVDRVVTLARRRRALVTAVLAPVALAPVLGAPLGLLHGWQAAPEEVRPDLACVAAARRAAGPHGRLVRYRTLALPPNTGILWGLSDIAVSHSQLDRRYRDLMVALNPAIADAVRYDGEVLALSEPALLDRPLLDLLGAAALVAGGPVDAPGWALVDGDRDGRCLRVGRGWWVYRNTEALPRAWLAPGFRALPDEGAVVAALLSPTFDPRGCALVEATEDLGGGSGDGGGAPCRTTGADLGSVAITRDDGDEVALSVTAAAPAALVLADAWAPGWEVTVDGAPAPLRRAHHILRAVAVPAGAHEIRFTYRPPAHDRGLAGTAIGLTACLGWLVGGVVAARQRRRRGAGGARHTPMDTRTRIDQDGANRTIGGAGDG